MTNNNMVVGRITLPTTNVTLNVPLNKAHCRKCKEVFYIVELIGGVCDDCRWEIKRKDRYDSQQENNERKKGKT